MFTLEDTVSSEYEEISIEKKISVIINNIGMGLDISDEERLFFLDYVSKIYLKGNKEVKRMIIVKSLLAKYQALFGNKNIDKIMFANDLSCFVNTLDRILYMMYVKYQIVKVLPAKGNLQALANEVDLFETYRSDLKKYSGEVDSEDRKKIRQKLIDTARFTVCRERRNNQ